MSCEFAHTTTGIIVVVSICSSLSRHNQQVKVDLLEQITASPLSSTDEDTVKSKYFLKINFCTECYNLFSPISCYPEEIRRVEKDMAPSRKRK